LSLALLAREQQGLAAHEKGVKAGATLSPRQFVHSPRGTALWGPSQAETAPCNSPRLGKGTRSCCLWAVSTKAAGDRAVA